MTEYKLTVNKKTLKEDQPIIIQLNNKNYALVLHSTKIFFLDGTCTHEGGPLGEGSINKNELICPWHSGAFDLKTGKADPNTSWVTDIHSYKIRVDEPTGNIFADI